MEQVSTRGRCVSFWWPLVCFRNWVRNVLLYNCILFFYSVDSLHLIYAHGDVIKWKYFPRYWPFVWVRETHRSPVNSPHMRLDKRLSKQPGDWWFETPSWSLWRHCSGLFQHNFQWCTLTTVCTNIICVALVSTFTVSDPFRSGYPTTAVTNWIYCFKSIYSFKSMSR